MIVGKDKYFKPLPELGFTEEVELPSGTVLKNIEDCSDRIELVNDKVFFKNPKYNTYAIKRGFPLINVYQIIS